MIISRRRWYFRTLLLFILGRLNLSCDHQHRLHKAEIDGNPITYHSNAATSEQQSLDRLLDNSESQEPPIELCGFEEPSAEQLAMDQARMKFWLRLRNGNDNPIDYTIPTYFHFLQYNSSDLFLSDSNVNTYMNYLNTAFNKSNAPFWFSLRGITRTINATWSNNCRDSNYQLAYKTLLRRGGKETLNIYICNTIPAGPNGGFITGFSTLPSGNPGVTDGVNIVRSTPTDLQRQNTLVHEVGHFLGLLHTFKDNCSTTNNGDLVDDTPYHVSLASTVNCKTSPTTWDTCPTLPGLDPVDNYMTYTTDNHGCRTRFSAGQVARMVAQFEMYRYSGPLLLPSNAPTKQPTIKQITPVRTPSRPPSKSPIISPLSPTGDSPVISPLPPTGDSCKSFLSLCESGLDCCSGKCGSFFNLSFFPKLCRVFF